MENELILNIDQHSEAEHFMHGRKYNGRDGYDKFPRPTFDQILEKFPKLAVPKAGAFGPSWGSAQYVKGADGMPLRHAENFDTSD